MNQKIKKFAAENQLSTHHDDMYGRFNGYQVSVRFGSKFSTSVIVGFHVNLGDKTAEILDWLNITQKKPLRLQSVFLASSGVYCMLLNMTAGSSLKKVRVILQTVTEYLRQQGIAEDVCPYCGQEMEERAFVEDNGIFYYAHEACFQEKLSQIRSAEAVEESRPNNYLRGFLGALIGGFVGMSIFYLLFQVGYLASISSLLGALLGGFLYSRFGGKNDKIKIVIVSVTVLICSLLAFFLSYLSMVGSAMQEAGILGDPLEMLFFLMRTEEEIFRAFWADFAMSIVFTVLGIVVVVIDMVRRQRKTSFGMRSHGEAGGGQGLPN